MKIKYELTTSVCLIFCVAILSVCAHAEEKTNTTPVSITAITVSPDPSTKGYVFERNPSFKMYLNWEDFYRERRALSFNRCLIAPKQEMIEIAGLSRPITHGPVPINMNPLDTASQRELRNEEYTRVELIGNGRGIFVSEAEGFGCHVSAISPDAAVFVQVSDNHFGIKLSGTIPHW